MARLTEEMVIARSKQSDLSAIRKLNCWGAELGDVSLLRRMPNLEVLALSINKIRSLEQFSCCVRLRELYVRKNDIRDLRQIRHLRRLPLVALWLEENPCATLPQYRATVLRNLPNLEKLDNVAVTPEEVAEAMRSGHYIPDSDEEEEDLPAPCPASHPPRSSPGDSPERDMVHSHSADRTSASPEPASDAPLASNNSATSTGNITGNGNGNNSANSSGNGRSDSRQHQGVHSPPRSPPAPPDRLDYPPAAMTRSHYEERSSECGALRHSLSTLSVKEAGWCNGERAAHHEPYCDRDREYATREWDRESARGDRERERDRDSARDRDRDYHSAVMSERRGFTRRPVARNSNLLSAVLCLIKELDYPALEVAEMAVRCRMDELAEGQ